MLFICFDLFSAVFRFTIISKFRFWDSCYTFCCLLGFLLKREASGVWKLRFLLMGILISQFVSEALHWLHWQCVLITEFYLDLRFYFASWTMCLTQVWASVVFGELSNWATLIFGWNMYHSLSLLANEFKLKCISIDMFEDLCCFSALMMHMFCLICRCPHGMMYHYTWVMVSSISLLKFLRNQVPKWRLLLMSNTHPLNKIPKKGNLDITRKASHYLQSWRVQNFFFLIFYF